MEKKVIFNEVAEILVSMLEVDKETIAMDTSLIDTLVMDSIQLIEFIMRIEETFHIYVNPESVDTCTFEKLSVLVDYIYKNINDEGVKSGN